MFKSLKYEYSAPTPDAALAIYKQAESASALIEASPIRYIVEAERRTLERTERDLPVFDEEDVDPDSIPTGPPAKAGVEELFTPIDMTISKQSNDIPESSGKLPKPLEYPPRMEKSHPIPQEFQLTISPSTARHEEYVRRQPYYGNFTPDKNSQIRQGLANAPQEGLRDWTSQFQGQSSRRLEDLALQRRRTESLSNLRELWKQGMRQKEDSELESIDILEGTR